MSVGGHASGAAMSAGGSGEATARLQRRFAAALMANYGVPPVALASGQGCRVWDADGRQYLDLIAGIAVSCLGHGHPAIVDAVTRQVAALAHTSNLFLHQREVELAERLLGLLGCDGRVFFTNSGTEANEAALKLVRRFHRGRPAAPVPGRTGLAGTGLEAAGLEATGPGRTGLEGTGRSFIVAAESGFHGRTMGSLALTGKAQLREPFGPFGVEVRFVRYGDGAALRSAVSRDCAAVFIEPGLGEGGVVLAPDGYLPAARAACDAAGAVLVVDEIQSGIGRTGSWFAHQHDGIRPDVLTLAKGLGGGLPLGACIGLGSFGSVFGKGDHGSTFGGNPVACAAALAVLDVIEREGLLGHTRDIGELLRSGIAAISHPLLAGVRGRGLWLAAVLTRPAAADIEAACRDAGFLVNAVQPDAIRLAPPLILTAAEAETFLRALPMILDRVAKAAEQAPRPDGGGRP